MARQLYLDCDGVLADFDGLLKVRGAQARCLECPSLKKAPPVHSAASAVLAELVLRALFE